MRKAILLNDRPEVPSKEQFNFELSLDEFNIIDALKTKNRRPTYERLMKQITDSIPRMKYFSAPMVKEMYYSKRKSLMFSPNSYDFFLSEEGTNMLTKLAHHPSSYLKTNIYPFSYSKKKVNWSLEEDILLKKIVNVANTKINFSFLSLCFPGRTGKQIHSHYLELLKKDDQLVDTRKMEITVPFDIYMHRYFLKNTEKILADEIIEMYKSGIQITEKMITNRAKFYYFMPWVISERIVYQKFMKEGRPVYTEDNNQYTEDFINTSKALRNELSLVLLDDNGEVDTDEAERVLNENRLPFPTFSSQWIKSFLKRNRLSWRNAHYSRRGRIDPLYANKYLVTLARAITKYSYSFVFNMDETAIRVVNGSKRTVAPIGVDQITINTHANDKECFTCIGTTTREKTYPLILITKGKTERSTLKFKIRGDTEVWPSGTDQAWMNEQLMLKYIQYLADNWSHGEPCALVCDCFKAHCTKKVIKLAKEYAIEMIFVPANGTADFQPLDRRIFGILKSKLRSLAGSRIYSGTERYELIGKDLMQSWSEINEKQLLSAWDIPNLDNLIKKIDAKEEFDEYDDIFEIPDDQDLFDWESEDDNSDSDDEDYKGRSDF